MVSKLSLLHTLLLASLALAAPRPALPVERRLARQRARSSMFAQTIEEAPGSNSTTVYSENWSGGVMVAQNDTIKSVTGTFTVPTAPHTSSSFEGASAWVGIDGYQCQTAIFQTGVDFLIVNGTATYDAWYEWYPDYSYDYSDITIKAGDVIQATVTTFNATSGVAMIENQSTGQRVSHFLSSNYSLCEQDAEWIVEDFMDNGGLVPFADFGTVTFKNMEVNSGKSAMDNITLIDIKQNGTLVTNVTWSPESLTVKYL